MSKGYESKTIKEALEMIESKRMLLPAIQRKFVWKEEQIIRLFDSLVCDYPINTFLFWDVDKGAINTGGYTFYEFTQVFKPPARNALKQASALVILFGFIHLGSGSHHLFLAKHRVLIQGHHAPLENVFGDALLSNLGQIHALVFHTYWSQAQ